MASAYNKSEYKKRLYKAIAMRDTVVYRDNHKTGETEKFRYSPRHIKDVAGITTREAFRLGVFKTPQKDGKNKKLKKLANKVLGSSGTKTISRRIKKQ